ncbi:hypothetical protein [Streptomyces sp. NPDC002990]
MSSAEVETGARSFTQVEEAFRRLEAEAAAPDQQTQFSRGALAGYLWALGRGGPAPITAQPVDGAPTADDLTAEVDAATAQVEDSTQRTIPRDYLHGVRAALAWVCGHTGQQP